MGLTNTEAAPRVHVYRPQEWLGRTTQDCPTCNTRRRFVVRLYEWYDTIWTCCGCGDSWSAGERMRRPFRRGWRAEATARARSDWNAATRLRDAVRAHVDAVMARH